MSNKLDSNKIGKRFYKVKATYATNAKIQALMRLELIKLLESKGRKSFDKVFEFGAGSGEFSKILCKNIEFSEYICNDICDYSLDFYNFLAKKYKHKVMKYETFDMNNIESSLLFKQKFDLITSNACVQWLNFSDIIEKLVRILDKNGVMLLSSFGVNNLCEVRKITGYGLEYLSKKSLGLVLKKHFRFYTIKEKTYTMSFENSLDIFRHLKLCGVNSCGFKDAKNSYPIIKKCWLKEFSDKFQNKITYHAVFIYAENSP